MSVLGKFAMKSKDYDGEVSKVVVTTAVLTAANFDAQMALRDALIGAWAAIQLGNIIETETYNEVINAVSAPSDPTAQRELAWDVLESDDTALKTHHVSVPTPQLSHLDANNRAYAQIGDSGHVDAFVAALEAYQISPAGNAVDVKHIKLKGRNL